VPSSTPELTSRDVRTYVDEVVFGGPRDHAVGLELEWLTRTLDGERPSLADLQQITGPPCLPLPHRSAITIEPGGQVELSTRPFPDAGAASLAVTSDLFALDETCTHLGIDLVALGHDPDRPPRCLRTDSPRYGAMLQYFDGTWPDAVMMMTNTASIQLNLGLGRDDEDARRRWILANELGPVLIAAFANSPFAEGRPSGWASTRWMRWMRIDPHRTAPLDARLPAGDAWHDYLWQAPVMLVRTAPHEHRPVRGLPFGRWVDEGHELGWPTVDDLAYHLTTLFPPVRPRGWFELRYLDSLPTPFWQVATTLVTRVLDRAELGDEVRAAVAPTSGCWELAATHGLSHPGLVRAARRVFELVLADLDARVDHDTSDGAAEDVHTYFTHWLARGRTPADDRLDHWRRTGELVPPAPVLHTAFEGVTR
jgi:glutamate--cysteine ligase